MHNETAQQRLQKLLSFLERDPDNLHLRADAIRVAHDAGRWSVADELLAAGLVSQPLNPTLRALLGFSCLQARRYANAEREFLTALSLGVEPAEVRYNLALSLFMQRRYADALDRLSAPLIPFELPMALILRARCLHHLRRLGEAIVSCEHYLAHVDADADGLGLLALLCYDTGLPDRARLHATAALALRENQIEARLVHASLQLEQHDFESAQHSFEALLRIDADCGRARLGLALVALNNMHLESARREIERAAQLMPEHIGTWHVLAWTALLQGDLSSAARAFDQAMALDRNFGESHGGRAVIAAIEGRIEEAQNSVKRALRLDPNSLSARYAKIVLLDREGNHKEAQAVLTTVLAQPIDGELTYRDLLARQIQRLGTRMH